MRTLQGARADGDLTPDNAGVSRAQPPGCFVLCPRQQEAVAPNGKREIGEPQPATDARRLFQPEPRNGEPTTVGLWPCPCSKDDWRISTYVPKPDVDTARERGCRATKNEPAPGFAQRADFSARLDSGPSTKSGLLGPGPCNPITGFIQEQPLIG
jgi:hypothetical protein